MSGKHTRSERIAGRSLKVDIGLARSLRVEPDDALSGEVVVVAEAEDAREVEALDFAGGERAEIRQKAIRFAGVRGGDVSIVGRNVDIVAGRSVIINGDVVGGTTIIDGRVVSGGGAQGFGARILKAVGLGRGAPGDGDAIPGQPSLALAVRVPRGFKVSLDVCTGRTVVGDVDGPLKVRMSGSCDLQAGLTGDLRLEVTGSGTAGVRGAKGDVRVEIAGSADVRIGPGEVGALRAEITGSGRLDVGGTVRDACVEVSGSGKVRLEEVTGTLRQEVTGSGSVRVSKGRPSASPGRWP